MATMLSCSKLCAEAGQWPSTISDASSRQMDMRKLTRCAAAGEHITDIQVLTAIAQASKTGSAHDTRRSLELLQQLSALPARCAVCRTG